MSIDSPSDAAPAQPSQRYGCVLFDAPELHDSGWAVEAGGDPYRVSSMHELSNEVIWLTNLEYDVVRESGLESNARFRRADYFWRRTRDPMRKMMADIGLDPRRDEDVEEDDERLSADNIAPILAGVFQRTMRHVSSRLNWPTPPMHTLRDGLRSELIPPDRMWPNDIAGAIKGSTDYYTRTISPAQTSVPGRIVTFNLPRVAHSLECLQAPLPVGDWQRVPKASLPKKHDDVEQWLQRLIERGRPALVQVKVLEEDPKYANLVNFGNIASRGQRGIPGAWDWVTSVELLWLINTARIEIKSAYTCGETRRLADWLPEHNKALRQLIEIDPQRAQPMELCYSLGLLLHNLWQALSDKLTPFRARGSKKRQAANGFTPFIRAVDRTKCFEVAAKLEMTGAQVFGYGAGHVEVFMPNAVPQGTAYEMALLADVLPPWNCGMPPGDAATGQEADTPLSVLRQTIAQNKTETLMQFDKTLTDRLAGEVR